MIRSIDIVGDTRVQAEEILQSFQLKTPNWLSWYKQDDRYSRETLQGDLERRAITTWTWLRQLQIN